MKVFGFSLSKMSVERIGDISNELKINANINIDKIEEAKTEFIKAKEEMFTITFTYTLLYEPKIANLEISGNLLIGLDSKIAKEVVKRWKNKEELPEDFKISLFNFILTKSSLKALQLEDELNLPPHFKFPTLQKKE